MNGKSKHGLRAAMAAGVAGLLLTGCGGGGKSAATTPDGWGTLDTKRLSVAYPKGFKEAPVGKGNPYEVARATLTEGGVMVASMSVEFDFGTGMHTADTAVIGAETRIQLGATPAKTTEIQVAGPDGSQEARKITYSFTSRGKEGTPPKGTKLDGMMVTGVDTEQRPYLITVNSKEGTLSNRDVSDIVDSVALKKTKK
ncbi:hypothetical protein [Streptomyces colonosanans]|uniref:Lipoprotein n=1 Tax=Streptomyces colonosanans TaxID=1428652 RepID=A0A1S2NVE2_9ACTN|nr:hypothetical protein [Streptomyces colonosanans]OIJ85407.1 hypothetical protein BIV24_28450 [Streptomyces colonosanans]